MENHKESPIMSHSLKFSISLMDYEKNLNPSQKSVVINQLIRSGTAIGAMVREAQGAESKKDFVHKMKIAYKEARETEYWLKIQENSYPSERLSLLQDNVRQMILILGKILSTCARGS